jgi:asparagine synthase (glutamine-hydrolysing)
MCGIAGVIQPGSLAEAEVRAMCDAIAHRGPDAHGAFSPVDGVVLGHRRLAIVDLDPRSDQPFVRGDLALVFNGEIYNFRELRKELSDFVEFTTESDTEVLLEGWRRWGVDLLPRLRGMFAFAIHDRRLQRTWLVRDHFGIKPVFFLPLRGGGLAFASELKALERVYRDSLTFCTETLALSLVWCWVPETRSPWREVRKLRPGHFLQIDDDGQWSEHCYWRPEQLLAGTSVLTSESEATAVLERTLLESVRAHMIADVPVCAFLSGGLDSSLLVAMAKREAASLDCYTIRFSDADRMHEKMADDASYAAFAADSLQVRLNVIDSRPDMAALLPKIVGALDEPIGDSAAIATFLICDAARQQGVKVLLSGMGADELFGGYRKHYACVLAQRYRKLLPPPLRALIEKVVGTLPVASSRQGLRPVRWAKRFTQFASLAEAEGFRRSYSYYGREQFEELVLGEVAEVFYRDAREHDQIYASAEHADVVNRMCYTDVQRFMVSLNEAYTDRASMAASTEVRVPYIDREVASLAFRIPGALKIRGGESKYVLKKVAERWLPHKLIYRPKSPFTLPLRSWIKNDLRDIVEDYVVSARGLAGREWLSRAALARIVADNDAGRADNAQAIWQLITIEQWLRNHGQ